MDWLEPLDFLPQCAQDRIAAEAAADAAETVLLASIPSPLKTRPMPSLPLPSLL